jgi:hypothetical protein
LKKILLAILLIFVGNYLYNENDLKNMSPLMMGAENQPYQSETKLENFSFKGFTIKPIYNYNITARILSKEKYSMDKESKLSTYDLTLGWAEMANVDNILKISISQRNRWYFWKTKKMFMSRNKIEHNSANVHIVHANNQILNVIERAKKGDIIQMKGSLIKADNVKENWIWQSSTSRKDTGRGACELFYVTDAYVKS